MSKATPDSTTTSPRGKGDAGPPPTPPNGGENPTGLAGVPPGQQQTRIVSRPEDVAGLVLMQIDMVNARKDDLTIAIKGLADLTRQLVRAYGENMQTIQQLQQRVKKLEAGKSSSGDVSRPSAQSAAQGSSKGSSSASKRK